MGANSKEYQREYYARTREAKRQYYLANRDHILAAKKLRPVAPRGPRPDEADRHYMASYGLTRQQVDDMSASLGHKCEVCGRDGKKSRWGRLHVDHCHATGVIRGLLCNRCNLAAGLMEDNPESLVALAAYLESRAAQRTA